MLAPWVPPPSREGSDDYARGGSIAAVLATKYHHSYAPRRQATARTREGGDRDALHARDPGDPPPPLPHTHTPKGARRMRTSQSPPFVSHGGVSAEGKLE